MNQGKGVILVHPDLEETPASIEGGIFSFWEYQGDRRERGHKAVVEEMAWTLVVNHQPWVTFLCTPTDLEFLALGFLYNAGVIAGVEDVTGLRILPPTIEVTLGREDVELPKRPLLTSGCSGGLTFYDLATTLTPLSSVRMVRPRQIYEAMQDLLAVAAPLYRAVGGFHTSALSDGDRLLVVAHDIGRHNTLDKIAGACLARGIPTTDRILVTTGRISTEMLMKAARMQVPVVISRNSPTALAVHLARTWNLTLIGYVRGRTMHVYSGEDRIAAT